MLAKRFSDKYNKKQLKNNKMHTTERFLIDGSDTAWLI